MGKWIEPKPEDDVRGKPFRITIECQDPSERDSWWEDGTPISAEEVLEDCKEDATYYLNSKPKLEVWED